MLLKIAVVVLLGAPAVAVLMFEVILNATAMFNHSNVQLPAWLESWLRLVIVTPDMHGCIILFIGMKPQQFRFQSALVGSPVRDIPGATPRRPSRHDYRSQ